MKYIAVYGLDSLPEWEIGYLTGGFPLVGGAQVPNLEIVITAPSGITQVTTMGGLKVSVDIPFDALDLDAVAVLVLPGGATWGSGHEEVLGIAKKLHGKGISVAGICGATIGLARAGLLNSNAHTSNTAKFLSEVPGYSGGEYYKEEATVFANNVITAPGAAPVSFAKAIFEATNELDRNQISIWHKLYSTGDSQYFDAVMSG